jgi:imidazolonepropionase-like amidohydrolase
MRNGLNQMLIRKLWKLAALAPLAVSLRAEVKVLKNFTLIDGNGGPPTAPAAMIIDNGRIQWVGPAAQLKTPAGAQTTDLSGKFVMPGIINLHCHLALTMGGLTQDAKFFTRENVEKHLRAYASYGVTTVLSMGTDHDLIFQMRDQQRATGRPAESRIFTTGQGVVFKGGYGGIEGVNDSLVSSVAEVGPVIDNQARKHVDFIKFWIDDHMMTMKKMPLPIAQAVIESAHKDNLRVLAHVFYLDDAKAVVGYGVNGLAHLVRDKPIDQALIDSMKRHGTWQEAATLSREASMLGFIATPEFLNDPFFTRSISPDTLKTLKSPEYQKSIRDDPHFAHYPEYLENAKKNFKKLVDAGIPYAFGTDTGPPGRFPGSFEHWELQLMVEAGLTPMQALTAATRSSAQFLQAKDLGTLEAGKWGDLIVLDRNPLENIKNTRTISAVYIAGNVVH